MKNKYKNRLEQGEKNGSQYILFVPESLKTKRPGGFTGNSTGNSLEFTDFKDYHPGDDIRHIDWNAYGRSDKLVIRLFREEIEPCADIIIDGSASMGLWKKPEAALGLAALIATAAINGGFMVRAWIAKQRLIPLNHGNQGPRTWENIDFKSKKDLFESFEAQKPGLLKRGIRIIISDLLFPRDPALVIGSLSRGAARVIICHLPGEYDMNPPFSGNVRIMDCETGNLRRIFFHEKEKVRYNLALKNHLENWNRAALKNGAFMAGFIAEKFVRDFSVAPLEAAGILARSKNAKKLMGL